MISLLLTSGKHRGPRLGASVSLCLRTRLDLGRATKVDLVRTEWPSGILQKLVEVPARILTVTEPQGGATNDPSLAVTD